MNQIIFLRYSHFAVKFLSVAGEKTTCSRSNQSNKKLGSFLSIFLSIFLIVPTYQILKKEKIYRI